MDCLGNLSKCKASCCKALVFYSKNMTEDRKNYYQVHGCKLLRMNREMWQIVVPVKCNALTDENLCSLHGTPEKPKVCNRLDWATKNEYLITENCVLLGEKEDDL